MAFRCGSGDKVSNASPLTEPNTTRQYVAEAGDWEGGGGEEEWR